MTDNVIQINSKRRAPKQRSEDMKPRSPGQTTILRGPRKLYIAIMYYALVERDKDITNKLMRFALAATLRKDYIPLTPELSDYVSKVSVKYTVMALMGEEKTHVG